MMQIYLKHPRHGKKIACAIWEADNDKKAGWVEITKEEYWPTTKEEVKTDNEREELATRYLDKFGKPPHHRMSNDSIRQKLEEETA